jgi:hypothetical protein
MKRASQCGSHTGPALLLEVNLMAFYDAALSAVIIGFGKDLQPMSILQRKRIGAVTPGARIGHPQYVFTHFGKSLRA